MTTDELVKEYAELGERLRTNVPSGITGLESMGELSRRVAEADSNGRAWMKRRTQIRAILRNRNELDKL